MARIEVHVPSAESGKRGIRQHRWMKGMLGSMLVFNLLDAILTLLVVALGLALEANPVMAFALEQGALPFVVLKLGLVSAGVLVLWRYRHKPIAWFGTGLTFSAYAAVMVWHVQSVQMLAMLWRG